MQAAGARRSGPEATHVCPGVVVAWVGARVLPILRGCAEEGVVSLQHMPALTTSCASGQCLIALAPRSETILVHCSRSVRPINGAQLCVQPPRDCKAA